MNANKEIGFEIDANTDPMIGQIKAILYLLQTHLETFSNEVDRSYALNNIGEKTPLINDIEKMIKDPVSGILDLSSNIDNKLKKIIEKVVISYLTHKSEIIEVAFKTKTMSDDLHYTIVLKEDNNENRNSIFDFFDSFDMNELSKNHPVYFQFVRKDLIGKINTGPKLELHKN